MAQPRDQGPHREANVSTAEQVRTLLREACDDIFTNVEMLQQILLRHEKAIHRRWLKRRKQERLNILLEAWPTMPLLHRPDFKQWREDSQKPEALRRRGLPEYESSYLSPYINQEDLPKGHNLLLLLDSRGRCQPWEFAAADREAMMLGRMTGSVSGSDLDQDRYVVILNGVSSTEEYGKLVPLQGEPDQIEFLKRTQFPPAEAVHVLQTQAKVLKGSVKCCKILLHDYTPEALVSGPVQPEPQLTIGHAAGPQSLLVMSEEAPYRRPTSFDFDQIESLLAARVDAAEDHLMVLREDPGHLAETLLERKEHSALLLKDISGKPHPRATADGEIHLWTGTLTRILSTTFTDLETFSKLQKQVQRLQALQAKYSNIIQPSEDLPEEFLVALLTFRDTLHVVLGHVVSHLKDAFMASPAFREFVYLDSRGFTHPHPKKIGKWTNDMKDLMNLLEILWNDRRDKGLSQYHVLPLVVDELEHLLATKPKIKELISEFVEALIEDMSLISLCLVHLSRYQPWASSFDALRRDKKLSGLVYANFTEFREVWTGFGKAFGPGQTEQMQEIVRILLPLESRLKYPIEKRRTQENVATLRSAEAVLDEFWGKIDQQLLLHPRLKDTASGHLEPRPLQRTPEWTEPIPVPKRGKGKTPNQNADFEAFNQAFSGASLQESKREPLDAQTTKVKVKTKGTPALPNDNAPAPDGNAPEAPAPAQPTIPVDARAYRAFRHLFPSTDPGKTPGEIPWKEFLHAMLSIGFSATQVYGAAWQFKGELNGTSRSIIFHQPHDGNGNITTHIARRMGRRLNRRFDWTSETFAVKEREVGERGGAAGEMSRTMHECLHFWLCGLCCLFPTAIFVSTKPAAPTPDP